MESVAWRVAWQILLLGLFLTPFTLVRPVQDFGVSAGDVALLVGAVGVVVARWGKSADRPAGVDAAVVVVGLPGTLLVLAVLLSTLVNPSASLADATAVGVQYLAVLIVIPLALAAASADQRVAAAKAFVYGFAAMIIFGLAVTTFASGLEATLTARGWMSTLGSGRKGLFTGVGDLSKGAGMAIGVVYYLVATRRISAVRAGALLGVFGVALIVTRSASGILAAVASGAVIVLLHTVFRHRVKRHHGSINGATVVGVASLGAVFVWLALQQLDARGGGFKDAFLERLTRPLADQGVEAVGSAGVRRQLLFQGWEAIGRHPLFGLGPGVFQQDSFYGAGVHVVPVMLWVELGILGLVAWVIFAVGAALLCLSRLRVAPAESIAALGVLVAMLMTHAAAPYLYGRLIIVPFLLALMLTAHQAPAAVTRPGHSSALPKAGSLHD